MQFRSLAEDNAPHMEPTEIVEKTVHGQRVMVKIYPPMRAGVGNFLVSTTVLPRKTPVYEMVGGALPG